MDTPDSGLRGDPGVPSTPNAGTRDPQSAPPAHPLSVQWREQAYLSSIRLQADVLRRCADHLDAFVVPSAPPEVCICAAVTMDGRTVIGHRHCDAMRTALDQCAYREGENGRITRGGALVQGFVTSRGRFVDRTEGMALQRAAGIESKAEGGYRGDILFSEDLY